MKLWGRSVCNPLGVCRRIVSELKPRTLSDGSSRRWVSADSAGRDPVSNIRNVGVMAHIDAGKTTTTERMLFYAGFTKHMGDVDDGDTVMDFMEQERERGITINSAAISFEWLQHQINLIDTPGHVDFTFEVERSLRVLDGAVVVFDGSAGVETQSVTVWRQACHYKIPRVAFVNKMDKPGTSLSLTVESMKQKLDAVPLITQLPLGQGKDFTGVIDLLSMDILVWERGSDGSEFTRIPLLKINQDTGVRDFGSIGMLLGPNLNFADLPVSRERIKDALDHRSMLAEQVVSMDDVLIERVSDDLFDPLTLTHDDLITGIRRLTTSCSATPLLCGSSLHNVGVQPLMDAILAYLPGPLERPLPIPEALKGLYAYAFKVMHDKRRGPMVFLRIYSGQIEPHTTVHNISRNTDERVSRVLLMLADEQREVGQMEEGKIAVAVGMKNTSTGDTIVRSGSAARSAERELVRHGIDPHQEASGIHILGKISVPPPVFFCSVEPATAAIQKDLDHALSCLAREDPSLRVSVNQDTGQTVLSGMGELHLEVVHDRLRRDYRLDCSLGKLQVAYKECPTIPVSHKALLDRSFGSKRHQVSLALNFSPNQDLSKSSEDLIVHLDLTRQQQEMLPGGFTKAELITAIREGVETACLQGPLLGYPVVHLSVSVSDLTIGPTTSLAMLSACISEGMVKGLQEAEVELLEPCTHLVVTVPEEYMGKVLGDLSSHRRAHIQELGAQEAQGKERVITAITPLAGLMGYSTALRTMTSGTATFVSTFSHYEPVSKDQEKLIMQELRGYIY